MQNRSYPNSVGRHQGTEGWEFVERWDLAGNAGARRRRSGGAAAREADARRASTTVILDGSQVALQIHESCGHAIELDRVLGTEAAFAGTSFLTTDKLGSFRYGSDLVNMTADATIPGGLGTFGYDDEGVPAQRDAGRARRHVLRLPDVARDGGGARPDRATARCAPTAGTASR